MKNLIERLRAESLYTDKCMLDIMHLRIEAALELERLQTENVKLIAANKAVALDNRQLRNEMEQVKTERDAAVECCRGYCESCAFERDCAKHDMNDAAPTRWYYGDCEDWEWRGPEEG